MEFYQQMTQSHSFNGNDLMVLLVSKLEYQNDQIVLNSYIQVDDQILLIA